MVAKDFDLLCINHDVISGIPRRWLTNPHIARLLADVIIVNFL
jgi:hypothetical protein